MGIFMGMQRSHNNIFNGLNKIQCIFKELKQTIENEEYSEIYENSFSNTNNNEIEITSKLNNNSILKQKIDELEHILEKKNLEKFNKEEQLIKENFQSISNHEIEAFEKKCEILKKEKNVLLSEVENVKSELLNLVQSNRILQDTLTKTKLNLENENETLKKNHEKNLILIKEYEIQQKQYIDEILNLKGNIRVFVRVKGPKME